MASSIVGLDIGSAALRAVEVQGAAKSPTVLRYAEELLPQGSVRGGEVLEVGTVAASIKKLWATGGFKSKDVVLGMGGSKVYSRDLSVPSAPIERIREALPFQVQDLLPLPVSEALMDFYPISEETTEDGPMVHGLLVAAAKDAVSANVSAVMRAGLNPVQVDLVPFALTRAFIPLQSSASATVLVGIGATTTHIVIAQGGVPLYVRMIASGGDDVTRSIATRLQVSGAQAESLKRQYGLAVSATREEERPVLEAIYLSAWDLLGSIRDTISYFTSSRRTVQLDRLVLSGGGTALPGLPQALSDITSLPVATPDVVGAALPSHGQRASSSPALESLSTAFGLALGSAA